MSDVEYPSYGIGQPLACSSHLQTYLELRCAFEAAERAWVRLVSECVEAWLHGRPFELVWMVYYGGEIVIVWSVSTFL
jgi:hypothetical protein